jgi:3',5'-cyclic AMP phosphodiesterase CpdA
VSPETFGAIWGDFMRSPEAAGTFSYAVRVTDRVWLALLDVSQYRDTWVAGGLYTDAHRAWLTGLLGEAGEQGAAVVAVAHQSVLLHSPLSPEGFSIRNREILAEDLRRGGVRLCLTGHVHIQHRVTEEGLTDVATGALSVSPHRYGWVTVGEDGQASYEMRALTAGSLPPGFPAQSALFFAQTTVGKLVDSLAPLGLTQEELGQMLTLAARFNSVYFGGTLDVTNPQWKAHPGWALWQRHGSQGFGAYMNMTFRWEESLREKE